MNNSTTKKLLSGLIIWTSIFGWCADSNETNINPNATWANTTNTEALKDWTYTQKQSYKWWDKDFYLDISTTIKNGIIEDITVVWDPNWQGAVQYEQEFNKWLKEKVIWKNLDDAKTAWVLSWSSGSTKAFQDALDTIKKQATSN